jgi:hypothetical protein
MTEEQSNHAAMLLRFYTQQQLLAHPWLSFDHLVEIAFCDDYETAVREAAGPMRTVGPTIVAGGDGKAMALYSQHGAHIMTRLTFDLERWIEAVVVTFRATIF